MDVVLDLIHNSFVARGRINPLKFEQCDIQDKSMSVAGVTFQNTALHSL